MSRRVYCHIDSSLGEAPVVITEFSYTHDHEGISGLNGPGVIIEDIKHNVGRDLSEDEQEQLEQACMDCLEERKEQLEALRI